MKNGIRKLGTILLTMCLANSVFSNDPKCSNSFIVEHSGKSFEVINSGQAVAKFLHLYAYDGLVKDGEGYMEFMPDGKGRYRGDWNGWTEKPKELSLENWGIALNESCEIAETSIGENLLRYYVFYKLPGNDSWTMKEMTLNTKTNTMYYTAWKQTD